MVNAMSEASSTKTRAELFRYVRLEVSVDSLRATFELDDQEFVELVTFDGVDALNSVAGIAIAQLWYLLAGLSYYKAGAPRRIDLGTTPVGSAGRALLEAAVLEGLAEFSFRNDLPLSDVVITGGVEPERVTAALDQSRVLVPFGGGIDSIVTTSLLAPSLEQALFIVSPPSGRFAPIENAAEVSELAIVRATRHLDPRIVAGEASFFNGHVPITAMITVLAALAAVASGRGGVVMSNEHSASEPNLRWRNLDVNHQWSKSWRAEQLIGDAIEERIGDDLVVASFLRDRSEVWVAQQFSELATYHHVFLSCNRAFAQDPSRRLTTWCGECDKCLFINLVLAPFLSRETLRGIFHHEPLSDPTRDEQLRVLVGAGIGPKPFECVGDPDESAVALTAVVALDTWHDVATLAALADEVNPDRTLDELLQPQGPSRVPAHWLR
jgi:hypothetical protein